MDNKIIPFDTLPEQTQEILLWDMNLDYDSYESSREQTIHNILCGQVSNYNKQIIEAYYDNLKPDHLSSIFDRQVENANRLLGHIDVLQARLKKS